MDLLTTATNSFGFNVDSDDYEDSRVSSADSFIIEEKTGDGRLISLEGRALPIGPYTLEGEQRIEVTHYPGNPIGTAQVFGAKENETSVSGRWSDRFLKQTAVDGTIVESPGRVLLQGQQIQTVVEAIDLIDDVRMRGQLVEVRWGPRVRQGFLRRFKQTWKRREVCEWEMGFEWISRGERAVPVGFNIAPTMDTIGSGLSSLVSDLLDAVDAGFALLQSVYSTIDNLTDAIQEGMDTISGAIDLARAFTTLPQDVQQKVSAALDTIGDDCTELISFMQSAPPRAMLAKAVDDVSLGEAVEASSWSSGVREAALALRTEAVNQQEALSQTYGEEDILDIFVAQENTDLRDVSTRYYGTAEQWTRLMTYNGLVDSKLSAGMEIIVPTLRKAA